jgi:type IV pilus secretin PilQ/predicted competence protein
VDVVDETGQTRTLEYAGGLSVPDTDPNTETLNVHVDNVFCQAVLEALAFQAGLNVIFVGVNETRIRLHMQDVTWEEAFQAVLQASGCAMTRAGRSLTILDRNQTLATRTFALNHAQAKKLEATVTRLLSPQGKIGMDERLNALVVTDIYDALDRIDEAIQRLDRKAPQVLIEVLIVNVKLSDERKLGMDWQLIYSKTATEGIALTQELGATTLTNPYGSAGYNFIDGDYALTGLLDFIRTHEDVTVLSSPKVLVLSNQTASINAVEEIPYQQLSETSQGGSIGTTAFKDAGVTLEVTPQISEDGYIIMHVTPTQSARVGTFTIAGTDTPIIETRGAETSLRVKDGQTIIIGGLRKKEPYRKESRVPLLGDIPLLGKLFRQEHVRDVDSELSVFITPRIYREEDPPALDMAMVDTTQGFSGLWDKKMLKK